ncbi:MAG: HNH endonuclease [Gemmataceae bacterium]
MATAEQWLAKLAKLKVDRASGNPAPHKPLLLLVILELSEQGSLPPKTLALTPELAFRFSTFWAIVAHRRTQKPDVRLPFHHLQSDGFWSCFTKDGEPSPDNRLTHFAQIPSDFVEFVRNPIFREKARRILIATYFEPAERVALYTAFGLPIPREDEIQQDAAYKAPDEARRQGRETRFRLDIVATYNYTCALSGYRLTTVTGASIVDAAHIHQFSDSRNNDIRNGVALCKNAHWLFDNGLWTISDAYEVIVAVGHFTEASPDHKSLASYHGQKLRLPTDKQVWPNPIHLAWHRNKRFRNA